METRHAQKFIAGNWKMFTIAAEAKTCLAATGDIHMKTDVKQAQRLPNPSRLPRTI